MFVKVTRNCVFGYWLYDMSDADHPEQGSVACFTTKGGGEVKPSVLTLPGHKYVKLMYALQGKKTRCRKDITALPIVSQGFLLLGEQVCFSRFCFFPVSLTEHKKAKDTGGRHSWYTGRGSDPCGVFAEITLGFFTFFLHSCYIY